MKNKSKKKLKKNIFSFIIGTIIFGVINVYAVTYYASSATIYDNSASKMKSTNVQNAIDELYNTCFSPTASATIIENGNLKKDPYECRYFFTGGNPNNYITFNNEQAGWRIISVECDGTIKIMRINSIRNQFWNSNGGNDWTNASLKTYLNGTYYEGLSSKDKNKIVDKDWGIGGVENYNNSIVTQIYNENGTKWSGKIALITVSEYIRTNSNKTSCGTFNKLNTNDNSCINTGWMHNNTSTWWTLSPINNNINYVYYIGGRDGGVSYSTGVAFGYLGVRPALYLSSDVQITGGNGTQNNPYTIK